MCDEDIAEYTCIARNVCSRTHLELNAKETPVLAKLPEVMAASKGQNIMLTSKLSKDLLDQCDKVQWNKNGKFLLDENSKYSKYDIKRGKNCYFSVNNFLNYLKLVDFWEIINNYYSIFQRGLL